MTIRPRRGLAAAFALACVFPCAAVHALVAADTARPDDAATVATPPPPIGTGAASLTAQDIVDKCLQAHGGSEAWRKLESIFWKGYVESERLPMRKSRFELTEMRPNKTRFEMLDPAFKSVRVFDGSRGWKMRFGQDGKPSLQAYSDWEAKYAAAAPGLNGPLVEFFFKNASIQYVGQEKIEGVDCYRLAVRLATGEEQTIWVDARTFLETRYDRVAYGENGPRGVVSTYFRDYRVVEGMPVPAVVEVGGQASGKRDRLVIESVALNPKIPDGSFGRPPGVPRSHEVVIPPTAPGQ